MPRIFFTGILLAVQATTIAFGQTSAPNGGKNLLPPPGSPAWRESVDVTVGEISFRVPKPYFRTEAHVGRATLVGMWALLPDFAPLSSDNFDSFDDNTPDSKVVSFALRYASRFRYPTPRDQLGDLVKRGVLVAHPMPGALGLARYPLKNPEGVDAGHDYFFGQYGPERTVLLDCTRDGVPPSPSCLAKVYLGGSAYLEYNFKTRQVQQWRNIDEKVRFLIESFKRQG